LCRYAEERKEGIRALRSVLWAEGEAALADRNMYIKEVNRHLTSAEAVDLFVEAPDHVPADADEVYQSALVSVYLSPTRDKECIPPLVPSLLQDSIPPASLLFSAASRSRFFPKE
jgi:hypothetical protein